MNISEVRQTKCSTCEHLKVCKFKDDFLLLVEKVERLTTDKLDIHWMEFKCAEYKQRQTVLRGPNEERKK